MRFHEWANGSTDSAMMGSTLIEQDEWWSGKTVSQEIKQQKGGEDDQFEESETEASTVQVLTGVGRAERERES